MNAPAGGTAPHPVPLPQGEGKGEGSAAPSTAMADPSAVASAAKADRRLYVWWGAALALLAVVGAFCWFVVRPWMEVRSELRKLPSDFTRMKYADSQTVTEKVAVRLGGREQAARKLALYARLPESCAPRSWLIPEIAPACAGMRPSRSARSVTLVRSAR